MAIHFKVKERSYLETFVYKNDGIKDLSLLVFHTFKTS